MSPVKEYSCHEQLAIVEKYERIIAYLYPIAQSIPRKHGTAREMFLRCLMSGPEILIQAGKSNQVSKLYTADAQIANLRFWVRFLLSVKCLTAHQQEITQNLISEVGAMLGHWIKSKRTQGQTG